MLQHVRAEQVMVRKRIERRDQRKEHRGDTRNEPRRARIIAAMREGIRREQRDTSDHDRQIGIPRAQQVAACVHRIAHR